MTTGKDKLQISPRHILVVDDDPQMREMLAVYLNRAGYRVSLAEDGLEAMSLVETDKPDVVVTDWDMPQSNGNMLCGQIRENVTDRYTYLLLMTAHTDHFDLADAIDGGADGYITKPVAPRELLAQVGAGCRILDLERKLRHLATHDSLTGVRNRRDLISGMEQEFARFQRFGTPFSALMIDIDGFKTINDECGHVFGDEVLKHVATLLGSPVRPCDIIGRFGGDEFCMSLANTTEADAAITAERLRQLIADKPFVWRTHSANLQLTFGVAECDESTIDPMDLIDRADHALIHAKQLGRNCVICATDIREAVGSTTVE